MHYEIDFGTWDTPDALHTSSTLYIQRGKSGYASREVLSPRPSDMFQAELEMFAEACRTGRAGSLNAHNGNVALAVVYAALRSIERQGQAVRVSEVLDEARARAAQGSGRVA
jgi:predicted dehydrogenase